MAGSDIFEVNGRSPLPECVELDISCGQGTTSDRVIVLAELICGRGRLVCDDITVYIEAKRGQLKLHVEGGKIEPGSRYAEQNREPEIIRETEVAQSTARRVSAGAEATASISHRPRGSLTVTGGGNAEFSETRKLTFTETGHQHRVRATAGGVWDVSEINPKAALDGRYLGQAALCTVTATSGIESIRAEFLVQKADVLVPRVTSNDTGSEKALTPAKRKLIQILAGKAIRETGDQIVMASSEMTFRVK